MKTWTRVARLIALSISLTLVAVSFGPEAWAQTVPIVEGLSAPVGGASSAAGAAAAPGVAIVSAGLTASVPLAASPFAASSAFLSPTSAAEAPGAARTNAFALERAAPAPAAYAATYSVENEDAAADPSSPAPAAAPALAPAAASAASAAAPAAGSEAGRVSGPSAARAASRIARRLAELRGFVSGQRAAEAAAQRKDTQAYWEAHQGALLSQAQALKGQLDDFARRRELELGPAGFQQELEKNAIAIKNPELGKAKMTLVDGQRIVRVVQAATELSYLFLDAETVSRDSEHLKKLVARQMFDAGADRTDGRLGRNPVVVWQKGGRTFETEFHQKPAFSFSNADWWRQYWQATKAAPTATSWKFGIFMGVLQGLLAWGVGWIHLHISGTPITLAPIVFTTGFGTLIGAFMSFYRNWTYRGSKASQMAKSAVISLAFAYPVIIFTNGIGSLTWLATALLFFNVSLNNTGKVAWQAVPVMFEKYNHYQSSRPLFWGFKVGYLLNQASYLINWTLRLVAMLIPTWVGYTPLVIGIIVGYALSYWYAKRHRYAEAAQMFTRARRLLSWLRSRIR